jgi:hypothetical protein
MIRAVVWVQILVVLSCVGYSTYSLFLGNFDQALLPYPILILYYVFFCRRRIKNPDASEGQDSTV